MTLTRHQWLAVWILVAAVLFGAFLTGFAWLVTP